MWFPRLLRGEAGNVLSLWGLAIWKRCRDKTEGGDFVVREEEARSDSGFLRVRACSSLLAWRAAPGALCADGGAGVAAGSWALLMSLFSACQAHSCFQDFPSQFRLSQSFLYSPADMSVRQLTFAGEMVLPPSVATSSATAVVQAYNSSPFYTCRSVWWLSVMSSLPHQATLS